LPHDLVDRHATKSGVPQAMSVDLIAFGPHPDDIEIGMGGTIARDVALGLTVGLCDLTAGERGSNGTVEERLQEAQAAREVLGAAWRANLRWPDGGIGKSPSQLDEAVAFIRTHHPRTVAVPYWSDRHPDHVAASELLTEAVFQAGLRRYGAGDAWKADWICYYFINNAVDASFVVDVSDFYEQKQQALDCHATQFTSGAQAASTRLNSPLFRQLITSRDAQFGARAGVRWAEGFVVREPIVRGSLARDAR
jgi:bacillithiol biosynthesis deacetylase BshB1